MVTKQREKDRKAARRDDWSVTAAQTLYMMQRHNAILAAYEHENMEFLAELGKSQEYKAAFGKMGWDEAFDRYESTWIDRDEASLTPESERICTPLHPTPAGSRSPI